MPPAIRQKWCERWIQILCYSVEEKIYCTRGYIWSSEKVVLLILFTLYVVITAMLWPICLISWHAWKRGVFEYPHCRVIFSIAVIGQFRLKYLGNHFCQCVAGIFACWKILSFTCRNTFHMTAKSCWIDYVGVKHFLGFARFKRGIIVINRAVGVIAARYCTVYKYVIAVGDRCFAGGTVDHGKYIRYAWGCIV